MNEPAGQEKSTILFEAIERGDSGKVWQLVQNGALLGAIDPSTEMTALALSAESGSVEIVRTLLGAGADPNLGGATTPLEAAVVEGHCEIVDALIAAGVDVNLSVEDGFTPLMTAATTGNLRLVQALLDAGARPQLKNAEGDTAISLARAEGHEHVVEELRGTRLRRRLQVEAAAEEAAEAEAARRAEEAAAAARAARKVAEEAAAAERATAAAAETAAEEPHPQQPEEPESRQEIEPPGEADDRFERMLQQPVEGTVVDASVPAGEAEPTEGSRAAVPASAVSPIDGRLGTFKRLFLDAPAEKIRQLVGAGEIDAGRRDEAGDTALLAAAHYGDPEVVRVLVEAGADVNACDEESQRSVLIHAVNSSCPQRHETISLLVAAGAGVDQACGPNQRTALMHAAEADVYAEGSPAFALATKTLIELGANLEAQDRRGNTVWQLIKRNALGARTSSAYRRRLHHMLRILESSGAQPIASHQV